MKICGSEGRSFQHLHGHNLDDKRYCSGCKPLSSIEQQEQQSGLLGNCILATEQHCTLHPSWPRLLTAAPLL